MNAKTEILKKNSVLAYEQLNRCELCPRKCGVNRLKGAEGYCQAGRMAAVYSYFAHRGEEPALSGDRGSGTIFFTHCTMRCVYCQNFAFSQSSGEKEVCDDALAGFMLELQQKGCHNINLVTPSHYVPQILKALLLASKMGLSIPIVYNTSGYESVKTLKLLEGIVDIYLPDMRYGDDRYAKMFSDAADYTLKNREAVREMFRQVGNLKTGPNGIAEKGLIIRHLVLPGGAASTGKVFGFIAKSLSKDTHISLMSQYYPAHRAADFPEINRRITKAEYAEAADLFFKHGLLNGWVQDPNGSIDAKLLGTNIKKM